MSDRWQCAQEPSNVRALAVRALAQSCSETLAVCLRRVIGSPQSADELGSLLLLADDIVWDVQMDHSFVTDAARRAEVVARLRACARGGGVPARDYLVNLAVELSLAALKTSGRMPHNAGTAP